MYWETRTRVNARSAEGRTPGVLRGGSGSNAVPQLGLSARLLTSILGAITDVYAYTAFGIELQSGSGTINPFRYGAQAAYYRVLADLLNAWNRWLKVSIGRWNSSDPMGLLNGDTKQIPASLIAGLLACIAAELGGVAYEKLQRWLTSRGGIHVSSSVLTRFLRSAWATHALRRRHCCSGM